MTDGACTVSESVGLYPYPLVPVAVAVAATFMQSVIGHCLCFVGGRGAPRSAVISIVMFWFILWDVCRCTTTSQYLQLHCSETVCVCVFVGAGMRGCWRVGIQVSVHVSMGCCGVFLPSY